MSNHQGKKKVPSGQTSNWSQHKVPSTFSVPKVQHSKSHSDQKRTHQSFPEAHSAHSAHKEEHYGNEYYFDEDEKGDGCWEESGGDCSKNVNVVRKTRLPPKINNVNNIVINVTDKNLPTNSSQPITTVSPNQSPSQDPEQSPSATENGSVNSSDTANGGAGGNAKGGKGGSASQHDPNTSNPTNNNTSNPTNNNTSDPTNNNTSNTTNNNNNTNVAANETISINGLVIASIGPLGNVVAVPSLQRFSGNTTGGFLATSTNALVLNTSTGDEATVTPSVATGGMIELTAFPFAPGTDAFVVPQTGTVTNLEVNVDMVYTTASNNSYTFWIYQSPSLGGNTSSYPTKAYQLTSTNINVSVNGTTSAVPTSTSSSTSTSLAVNTGDRIGVVVTASTQPFPPGYLTFQAVFTYVPS